MLSNLASEAARPMRDPVAALLSVVIASSAGATLTGCCSDDVDAVDVSIQPDGSVVPSIVWVGDTITVFAEASRNPTSGFCESALYTSISAPSRFSYVSSDTTVATLSARGLLTTRAAGITRLVANSAGISGHSLLVIVSPAIASLRVTVATPAAPHVGDTVTFQVDALDGNGIPITGAQVQVPALLRPSDTLATWLPSVRPDPPYYPNYTFPTPLVARLVARHPGALTVETIAPHTSSNKPFHFIADTLHLTVATP